MKTAVKLLAPAKLNLSLDIVGRRLDGYHEMQMVMQSIDLFDRVELSLQDSGAIRLQCSNAYLPLDGRNIAVKAAEAFFARTGLSSGLEIKLGKQIPSGAGMGGGSADGAAVLWGLNRIFENPLSLQELVDVGMTVGADLPFCLTGGTALVEGIGERITPLSPLSDCFFVVIKPDFSINTAKAFAAFDRQTPTKRPDTARLLQALAEKDLQKLSGSFCNVFEDMLPDAIQPYKDKLIRAGALGALMTGSGSAVFGLFTNEHLAADCVGTFRKSGMRAWRCRPVPTGSVLEEERKRLWQR